MRLIADAGESGLTSVELGRMMGHEAGFISAYLSLLLQEGVVRKAGKRPGIARPVDVHVATGEAAVRRPRAAGHATDRPAETRRGRPVPASRPSPAKPLPEESWSALVQVAVRWLRRDDWVVCPLAGGLWMVGHLTLTEDELLAKADRARERRQDTAHLAGAV